MSVVRRIGEKLGLLDPPDEVADQARADAHAVAAEARVEINASRIDRGVPSLEYDLLRRGHSRVHR